jgi:hypothetical protein
MKNRDAFYTDPTKYRIANQGVAKIVFPPASELAIETLRGELTTFVCSGEYGRGLQTILDSFLRELGRGNQACVWISGFYGSGKSHLANMLCALWVYMAFKDGARASGLVTECPEGVEAALRELRATAARHGGLHAAGGTLGGGPDSPILATLGIVLQSVGLPVDFRAARVAFWLSDEGILSGVRKRLGGTFDSDIRNFVLSSRFHEAVLKEKPGVARDVPELRDFLRITFPQPPEITVTDLSSMVRHALLLGRKELPLTLIVLDEAQQFIRNDPTRGLDIQNIAERLSADFDGRLLLVCTGQAALSEVPNLQKLLGRFPVRVSLGEADMDAVIRQTVLRKKTGATDPLREMLSERSGEIRRQLKGSRLAHSREDDEDAVLDWPLLPARRRVWERILRSLDRSGLAGTLRTQLRVSLEAAQTVADHPLGHAVASDFLYDRFSEDAYTAGLLPEETRGRITKLQAGKAGEKLKARVLMLVYMLGLIERDADHHGVRASADAIADLLVEDLANGAELRRSVPEALEALEVDGAVIQLNNVWRLQTRESAEWETAYRTEERALAGRASDIVRERNQALEAALSAALSGAAAVIQGRSTVTRKIVRVRSDEKAPTDAIVLRVHSGWEVDLKSVEKEVGAQPPIDPTIHLMLPRIDAEKLEGALKQRMAAKHVINEKGAPQTTEGQQAQAVMASRVNAAEKAIESIARDVAGKAIVLQAGGAVLHGTPAEAVKTAASNALVRLYPRFDEGDHPGWEQVVSKARAGPPDAIKAVDHNGSPETHPVCKAIMAALGAGRKGAELRKLFGEPPYGWSQDAVDGALLVLDAAGQLRITGDDGRQTSLRTLDRRKIGVCGFRPETATVSLPQRLLVRGLLADLNVTYEKDQEAAAMPFLIERLQQEADAAGGEPPAPPPPIVPGLAKLRTLGGNDLLVELATEAPALRSALNDWRKARAAITARLPNFRLLEKLVALGATGQAGDLAAINDGRFLLSDPDPTPPVLHEAAGELRKRLNAAVDDYNKAWGAAEVRLKADTIWQRLTREQKHRIRQDAHLLKINAPSVATAQDIAETLALRSLAAWRDLGKALPEHVADALAEAAALLEPKTQSVTLPAAGVLKDEPALDEWLKRVREVLAAALHDGPVIPRG